MLLHMSCEHNKLNPLISWAQDRSHVFLVITCRSDSSSSSDAQHHGSNSSSTASCHVVQSEAQPSIGDSLCVDGPFHYLSLQLFDSVVVAESTFKPSLDGVTTSAVLKKSVPCKWPRLAKTSQKLHFVSPSFF